MCWKININNRFLIREFDDESIVYDKFSGSTHLIDFISSKILNALNNDSELATDSINLLIEREFEPSDQKTLHAVVMQHLLGLESQGFVSRAS